MVLLNTAFPKIGGNGGLGKTALAVGGVTAAIGVAKAIKNGSLSSATSFLSQNPNALDDLTKATTFKKAHINNGGIPTRRNKYCMEQFKSSMLKVH